MRLQTIKEFDLVNVVIEVYRGEKVNMDAVTDDIKWLIEQAEQLEKVKQISIAEDLTLADFAKEVLKIIEGRETPTREARV